MTTENPLVVASYPLPLAQKAKALQHLDSLEQQGIIKRSTSPYSSPVFFKEKKNGDTRLIGDFPRQNKITVPEHFPFPHTHDILLDLLINKFFSKIDLVMSFYQIEIHPKDTAKTAFSVNGKKYKYLRLPFGMRNAPFTFQKVMTQILGDLECVIIFVDDLLIFSKTAEEHIKDIKQVLNILKNNNISINFKKSKFGMHEVPFLGQIIDQHGIKAETEPFAKLLKLVPPKNKKDVKKIVGILQWFRPYVENLSSMLNLITTLLKKGTKLKWTDLEQKVLKLFYRKYRKMCRASA